LDEELDGWQEDSALVRIRDELYDVLKGVSAEDADARLWVALLLATVARRRGDEEVAYATCRQVLAEADRCHDDRLLLRCAALFSEVALATRNGEDAVKVLEGVDGDPIPYPYAIALSELRSGQGDHSGALVVLERALSAGDRSSVGAASALQRMGVLLETAGQLQAALDHFEEALQVGASLEPALRAVLTNSASVALLGLGKLDRAATVGDDAVRLAAESGSPDLQATALLTRGNVCAASGQEDLALRHYHAALVASGFAGSRSREVVLLSNIASSYLALGEGKLWVRYLMWALDVAEELDDRLGKAMALTNLASLSSPQEARALLSQAYAIYLAQGDARGQASSLLGLGTAARRLEELEDALEFVTEAGEIARSVGDSQLVVAVEGWRAETFIAQGDVSRAWQSFEDVWAWSERQRRETLAEGVRVRLDRETASVLEEAIALAVDEARRARGEERDQWLERLLAMLERTRARALVDRMRGPELSANVLPDDAQQALTERAREIRALRDELGSARGQSVQREGLEATRRRLRLARDRFDELADFFSQSFPTYDALASTEPVGACWVTSQLADDTGVIQFAATADRLVSVIVRRGGMHLCDHGELAHVRSLDQELGDLCRAVADEARAIEICHRLGECLLQPLARDDLLRGLSYLVVVPAPESFSVPLEALLGSEEHLFQNVALAYLPAISAARFLRAPTDLDSGLVLADPDGDLPYARAEGAEVSRAFGSLVGGRAFFGDEATKDALLKWGPEAGTVHIASHATFDSDVPAFAAVALAGGDRDPARNLEPADVIGARLKAGLVVLSGCDTGRASADVANEMIGLVRAFLCMGAASVVGTRWPVRDAAASEFMRLFYRYALRRGEHPLVALQRARRDHIETNGYTHPAYWAPYVYFGLPPSWPRALGTD
jgi:CHAT domain-containing protein/tetratricopeptide (TPR) repeat protein